MVQIYPQDPEKRLCIGVGMSPDMEAALTKFLHDNTDVFAWNPSDMPGIPREITEHRLKSKLMSSQCSSISAASMKRSAGRLMRSSPGF
jgi:hypothetical protein